MWVKMFQFFISSKIFPENKNCKNKTTTELFSNTTFTVDFLALEAVQK